MACFNNISGTKQPSHTFCIYSKQALKLLWCNQFSLLQAALTTNNRKSNLCKVHCCTVGLRQHLSHTAGCSALATDPLWSLSCRCRCLTDCITWHPPPSYLSTMCQPVADNAGRRHLRSAARGDLAVPATRTLRYGPRSFAVAGPSTWNSSSTAAQLSSYIRVPSWSENWTVYQGVSLARSCSLPEYM